MPPDIQKKERELLQDGFRYALSLTHNLDEAQDLIQDAWLNMYNSKSIHILKRAFLYSIIRNKFIDTYRKRFPEDSTECISEQKNVEEKYISQIEIKEVEKTLGKLKPVEREVLYLKFAEEYTAQEISSITGRPQSSVLSLLQRTRQKLSKLL